MARCEVAVFHFNFASGIFHIYQQNMPGTLVRGRVLTRPGVCATSEQPGNSGFWCLGLKVA